MNRKEKIQLLKAIYIGAKAINDLLPRSFQVVIWLFNKELDTYSNNETKEILNGKQFQEKVTEAKYSLSERIDVIVYLSNYPIANSEDEISEMRLKDIHYASA